MPNLWLTNDIFNWAISFHSDRLLTSEGRARAYEHLRHAEEILGRAPASLDLVDVITTLKRCVTHRVEYLWSNYRLADLTKSDKSKWKIDSLAKLGVVRPFF